MRDLGDKNKVPIKGKGYKSVALISPCRRYIRQFQLSEERVSDDVVSLEPIQKEIKDLLSRHWKPWHKSSNSIRQKRHTREGQRAQQRLQQLKNQVAQELGKGQNNTGQEGPQNEADPLDINVNEYQGFITEVKKMQSIGGGTKTIRIHNDIEIGEFAKDLLYDLDFEPWLNIPQYASIKDILITVDSSGSCMELLPLTKAIAKAMERHPELQVKYSENFNGRPYDYEVQRNITAKKYDLIIYFGDQDALYSDLADQKRNSIVLFMKKDIYGTVKSQLKGKTYHHETDFKTGRDLYEGILIAKDHFHQKI
jgi:hypothetical protein